MRYKRKILDYLDRSFAILYGAFFLSWRKQATSRMCYLFVLAHPRSGSTLLGHLLMSHPEILGYGENQVSYNTAHDLNKLLYRTAMHLKDRSLTQKYTMDKIVSVQHEFDESIKRSEKATFIVLARCPAETFPSMEKLHPRWKDESRCLHDYSDNLDRLLNDVKAINDPQRCLFLSYDQLTGSPTETLAQTGKFLKLNQPIKEEYQIFPTTGVLRYGDNSENIKYGRIIQNKKQAPVRVSSEVMAQANQCYTDFLEEIRKYATAICA